MLDRSENTYTRIPHAENEGFIHVKKINIKKLYGVCFICLVLACYVVNQYVYKQSSIDILPDTVREFNGEKIVESELLEARKAYNKHLELANRTLNHHNTSYITTDSLLHGNTNKTTITNSLQRNVFAELKDIKQTPNNIFFLETRCVTENSLQDYLNNTGFILNARQCCSIESTAFMNFDRPVYVFHSCPITDDFLKHSPKFVERLFNYPNVFLVRLIPAEVFNNTPVQDLYEKRQLETSLFPTEHTSDLIRLLVLWRFGGTYSDIDVVTIRSFASLHHNWAGSESDDTIANGVLSFQPDGAAHNILHKALTYVNTHFDGSQWSTNGPQLITPIILDECKATTVQQATNKCEGNFTVWRPPILYPIYYTQWELFFRDDNGPGVVQLVKKSAFSVHIWNKMSHGGVVRVGSSQAYALLASEFCPEVYQNCGPTF